MCFLRVGFLGFREKIGYFEDFFVPLHLIRGDYFIREE